MSATNVVQKVISKIYGRGRGWAFSQKDLTTQGNRDAVDQALHRLHKRGLIRRVLRGIYDYPRYSKVLDTQLSPDIDQVAHALARKFRWDIQPSGPTAMNILGLSTQVPGRYVYHSNGPDRSYQIYSTKLEFKNTALKETGFKHEESALLVMALKSLGESRIDSEVITKIRNWLDPGMCSKVLKDTRTVTGWVYEAIRKVCSGAS
ncbi:hypothetical protein JW859_08090 [bacterium]|nr:hypothetical protein [bacterium]